MNDTSHLEIERDLNQLSQRRTRFLWPLVGATLGTYIAVLIVLAYWPSLVATKVVGSINLAYILGVSQFLMTFAVAVLHARWAHRRVDPLAARIRGELERDSSGLPTGTRVEL